jgi:alpha-N-arabinofuranosidase
MGTMNWWQAPPITRIAGGENAERYEWTETLMKSVPLRLLGGLSVHCYVKPGEESNGTSFTEKSWYETAVNTYKKEDLFKRNISIMDYYDPDKKVLLAVDEWGIWVDNEPGTVPGFLYQQNTMRSALCSALMLHIFHKYADRIRLANLAQTINVLQAIILTEGARMIKTPTYHVFDLLKGHQDSAFIPVLWDEEPDMIERDLPHVDLSASLRDDGKLTVSAVNLSADKDAEFYLAFAGKTAEKYSGRLISGDVTAHNTFDQPDQVCCRILDGIVKTADGLKVTLPPCAIASLEIELH